MKSRSSRSSDRLNKSSSSFCTGDGTDNSESRLMHGLPDINCSIWNRPDRKVSTRYLRKYSTSSMRDCKHIIVNHCCLARLQNHYLFNSYDDMKSAKLQLQFNIKKHTIKQCILTYRLVFHLQVPKFAVKVHCAVHISL